MFGLFGLLCLKMDNRMNVDVKNKSVKRWGVPIMILFSTIIFMGVCLLVTVFGIIIDIKLDLF